MSKRYSYTPNRVIDTNGISDGATIAVYDTGTTTTVSLYSDAALTTPVSNPYTVAAGAAVPELYHNATGNVRVKVDQSDGTNISDDDPYSHNILDSDLASDESGKGMDLIGEPTVAAMLASTAAARGSGETWHAGGFKYIEQASGATDHHLTTAGGVKLKMVPSDDGYITTEQAGLVLDGSTDDVTKLQALADACVAEGYGLRSPTGKTCKIDGAVDLQDIERIDFKSAILVDPAITEIPVEIGGYAVTANTCEWSFDDVWDGTNTNSGSTPSRPIMSLNGAKAAKLELGYCNYLRIYSDANVTGGSSNAYIHCHFFSQVRKLELTDSGAGVAWVNEIVTQGGRFKELDITGVGYRHNHHQINDASLEGGGVVMTFANCSNCFVNGVRADKVNGEEGVASVITFDADTYSNQIEVTWSGTGTPGEEFNAPFSNVTDLGSGNSIHRKIAATYDRTTVFSLPGDLLVGNSSACASSNPVIGTGRFPYEPANLIPSLTGFQPPSFRTIALSPMIPVELGDSFGFDADFDGSQLRAFCLIFDEDMAPLTSEGGNGEFISFSGMSGPNTTDGFGFYSHASNQPVSNIQRYGSVIRSDVKYIRFGVFSGTTNPVIRHLSGHVWTKPIGKGKMSGAVKLAPIPLTLNGTPTRGYAPLGTQVWNTSGTPAMETVTYAHETILDGALAATDTSVTVTDIDTVANGDVVGIPLDDGSTHWGVVASLSGSTFTVAAIPASRSAVDNARVVFNRWA